jgi:hypothetical protein
MATYCKDADLKKYRPNIMDLGVESWADQREEAYETINRVINKRWYMRVAPEMGYDPTLHQFAPDSVANDNLKRLECFKTLELAYMFLKKDGPEADGFERNESSFRRRYNEELEMLLAVGIDYDWSGDDTVGDDEVYLRAPRRLIRG